MDAITLAFLSPEHKFIGVAVISAWLVLMCLKTLGHGFYLSVCWHNLKVETHNLRIQHERELRALKAESMAKAVRKQQIQQNPLKYSTSGATGGDGTTAAAKPPGDTSVEQAA
ncbi:MAG: hypothetical protein IID13_09895 [Candidatus Marinimicrobia bacterium]|nr:hypothetical protein [Candidatus Neomarinimicrobiota bacterium]